MSTKLQLTGTASFSSVLTYGIAVKLGQIIKTADLDARFLLTLTGKNDAGNTVNLWTAYGGANVEDHDFSDDAYRRTLAKGLNRSRFGNNARVMFDGRFGNFDTTADKTFELVIEAPSDYDAITPIFAVSRASATPVSPAGCSWAWSSPGSFADATADAAAWTAGLVGGASTFTLNTNAAVNRKTYTKGDRTAASAVARSDGGVKPLLALRVNVPATAGNISIFGNGTDSFANWAARTDGRARKMRIANGNRATANQGTFTANGAAAVQQNPIVGVEFTLRGKVVNIAIFGDSIDSGRGTYIGEGWSTPMAAQLESVLGVPVCIMNCAWSGAAGDVQRDSIIDLMAAGLYPDLAFVTCGSVNDFAAPIVDANLNTARYRVAVALAVLSDNKIPRVLRTIMATNPAVKDYNASDSKRLALNAETMIRLGEVVWDAAAPIKGVVDADGQENMLVGSTTDNIHPNDAGNALLFPGASAAALQALSLTAD